MRPAAPLPSALDGLPLTAALLRRHGVPTRRLRRDDMTPLGSGVFLPRHTADGLDPRERLRMRALGVTADHSDSWASHTTVAQLLRLPLPRRVEMDLHISTPRDTAPVRREGVRPHRATVHPGELRTVGQLPVSSAEQMFLECATVLRVDELIALGDALVRRPRPHYETRRSPYSSIEALAASLDAHRNVHGHPVASAALNQVRVGADSAPETRMRLALIRAGLPEPELQVPADPQNPRSPQADAAYVRQKLALQYDGRVHFDVDRAKQDRRVDRHFSSRGWTVLRYYDEDAREGFRRTTLEVRRALEAR